MAMTVAQIAKALNARLEGNATLVVAGLAEPGEAGPDDLAMAMHPKYGDDLGSGRARAAVLWPGADWRALGLEAAIMVDRPRVALSRATAAFEVPPDCPPGIHPTAHVDPGAELGEGVSIGPFVSVGPGARVGARARIMSHASIGRDARIGDDALIHAGARLGAGVRVGARFIAQPGAVIGGDGFSFVTPEKSGVETAREGMGDPSKEATARAQVWMRIASLAPVEIGDDVEIGANTTIDRGTIRATRIGSGTKLDNLVQIGHNVVIGRDCLICGQTGIAGSTRLGDRVVVAGHCAINDNIEVGNDAVIGGGSRVGTKVPSGRAVIGYPAMPMAQWIESYKLIRRLPRLFSQVSGREKSVSKSGQSD